jgi:arylsulfatase A-like enzyme
VKTIFLYLCLLQFFFFTSCSEKGESLPNIIYILADDLGYGDIGVFNPDSKIPTPHIDKIANEGMRFTDAHTSSSVCTPTRYGIMTGRYNWRTRLKNGVLTGKSKALIPNTRRTVASLLREYGYQTAFIGKWHLGWDWKITNADSSSGEGWDAKDFDSIDFSAPVTNTPNDLGFNYAYGHSGSLDMAPYVYVENGKVTVEPDSVTVNTGKYTWWRKGPTSSDFVHQDVTPNFFRRAINYISEKASQNDPFFLYLALPSPHTPILPTEKWQGKSGINPYGDFIMMIDDYVGMMTDAIKAKGLEENTLIIFTSDNGCSPAAYINELKDKGHEPGYVYRGHKADIFEGGHRVPFIAKWPSKVKMNTTSDETICTTDLLATCAQIVGHALSDDEGEDSYSLLPLFENQQLNAPLREATVHHSINGSFAIRKGDWKLIMCPGSGGWSAPKPGDQAAMDTLPPIQLYNLKNDPGEQNNVYGVQQKKVGELKSLLIKYIKEGRSTAGQAQNNDPIEKEWHQIDFVTDK